MSYAKIHGRQSSHTDYQENDSETAHSLNIQMEHYYANDPYQYLSPTFVQFHEKEVQTSPKADTQPTLQEQSIQVDEIKQNKQPKNSKTPTKKKQVTPKLKTPVKNTKKLVISTEERQLSEMKDKPSISPYSKKLAEEKWKREGQTDNSFNMKKQNKQQSEKKVQRFSSKKDSTSKVQSEQKDQQKEDLNTTQDNEQQQSAQKNNAKQKYIPLHERYQLEVEKKRKRMEEKQKKYEKENETKKPKVGSRKRTLNQHNENDKRMQESIFIFSRKEKRKEEYLKQKLAEKQREQEECTYRPKISKRSVEIARKRQLEKGNQKLEDRLIEYEQQRTVRLLQLLEDSQERRCFTPSPNSRKILEAKENLNKSVCPTNEDIPLFYIGDSELLN